MNNYDYNFHLYLFIISFFANTACIITTYSTLLYKITFEALCIDVVTDLQEMSLSLNKYIMAQVIHYLYLWSSHLKNENKNSFTMTMQT